MWRAPTTWTTSATRNSPEIVVVWQRFDPEKGSGIAMICTFGDLTDVTWWRELQLPTRPIIGWDGRILAETPAWMDTPQAQSAYAELAGNTAHSAKERIVELLRESGDMVGEPREITHAVKFFEKGDKPLFIYQDTDDQTAQSA
mgnify:CR=1 FL=1